tara:strand:+ start:818 stop:1558 length:741 start_codon:yes stop_codon:yes gene_type:complete
MITVEQAYAAGPDGKVDVSPGSVFQQFITQQNAAKAQVGPGSALAASLTPEQQYMQANPDVLNQISAMQRDPNLVLPAVVGARDNFAAEQARQHFLNSGQAEGRASFDMTDELGRPLSSFVNGVFPGADAINTQPFPVSTVTAPMTTFDPTTGQDVQTNMTGPTNYGPAPMAGQLPGYSFTGNPDFYANALGTMGGLLNDTSAYYAGQVPAAPTTAVQTGGYNFPELAMYPNANYAAGISPFIFTG